MSNIIKDDQSGYYFALGQIFIISDYPDAAEASKRHPELPVISEADLASPNRESLLRKAIREKAK
jgi:hypothetical protein